MTLTPALKHYDNPFVDFFSTLEDPRRITKGNLLHNLLDILFLTISATVSGSDDWENINLFGKSQIDWLRQYRKFENGIPSADTLSRVFSALDPSKFEDCFIKWAQSVCKISDGELIAIDGKRLRGSYDKSSNKAAIHIVSAFAAGNGICLGQIATDKKSNEIVAIPKLLDLLAIKGCTISIDAMGCQKDIAEKIRQLKANYILAVKNNQQELSEQCKKLFRITASCSVDIQTDMGHGRVEVRKCTVIDDLTFLDNKKQWLDLSCIIRIESQRYNKQSGKSEQETRYYISSCQANAKILNQNIRQHWSIENKLHWLLDVTFSEDKQRKRIGDSPNNFNKILKIASGLLKKTETSKKTSIKGKRYKAALDKDFREKVLQIS